MPAVRFRALAALVALAALLSSGCLNVCYIAQAAAGQDEIGFLARPIDEVIADPAVPAKTRKLLGMIEDVKQFGEKHGLTRTDNYRRYADLKRAAAVWVVTASQALRFEPVTWRFPVVGAVPYLGWFDKRDAARLAHELQGEGYDVYLREARAYSMLGWFDDPVLSTMLKEDDPADLVEVVIHEPVHATHYVASQTLFNESLANFVAELLTAEYLRERLHADRWQIHDYHEGQHSHDKRVRRLHETYLALAALYASHASDAEKLAEKARILGELRRELGLSGTLNNAVLAQAQTYNSGGQSFARLLTACAGDWPRFLKAIRGIDTKDFRQPDQREIDDVVDRVAQAGCR